MNIHAGKRNSGKTVKLVKDCIEKNGILVVENLHCVPYIHHICNKFLYKDIPKIVTYREVYHNIFEELLFIDDMERFLECNYHIKCGGISLNSSVNKKSYFKNGGYKND